MIRLGEGAVLVLARLAAPVAGTRWWMMLDGFSLGRILATPIPYALFALTWFVALPLYAASHLWHGDRLLRLLLLASLGAMPFVVLAVRYFLTPRDIFAAILLFTTAWAGTIALWGVVRLFGAAHENARPE